jgi:predicted amidophosphoribosyltransferase
MSGERAGGLSMEPEHLTCWGCGEDFKATGHYIEGNPVCPKCLHHYVSHELFDPRCSLCRLEVRNAARESYQLESWQHNRNCGKAHNAPSNEG